MAFEVDVRSKYQKALEDEVQVQCRVKKNSKTHTSILDVAKMVMLMASACSNSPGARVSGT